MNINQPLRQACLEQMHSDVYTENFRDHFAIRKIEKVFSMIAVDQAQKQNIVVLKYDRGLVLLAYKAFFLSRS